MKMGKVHMIILMIGCLLPDISNSPVPHDHKSSSRCVGRSNGHSYSALHRAAARNRLDIMEVLLRENISDINERSPDGSTVLHMAAATGNRPMISFILQYENVLVSPKNNKLFTPLVLAERNRHPETAALLRATIGDISAATLVDSAFKGDLNKVRSMILRGADVNGWDGEHQTALHKAARINNLEMVKFLVEHGADLSMKLQLGQIPLFEAAYYGNLNIVIYLVENGSEINALGNDNHVTPMHAASDNKHPDVVKYLRSVGGIM